METFKGKKPVDLVRCEVRALWLAAPLLVSTLLVLALASPDEAHANVTVPSDWPLIPSDIDVGDRFRLLFITHGSDYRTSLEGNRSFERLDNTVQNAVRHGHEQLRMYAGEFQALASCGSTDARHHTSTTYTSSNRGVPIYWVGGDKVADDYRDFYDGSWDSLEARDQTGWSWNEHEYIGPPVYTGTNTDGTSHRYHACNSYAVTYGYADKVSPGNHFTIHIMKSKHPQSLYGLSLVFTVSNAPGSPGMPTMSGITHNSASLAWDVPTSSGATSIFDYNVQIKRAGGSWTGSTPYHWGTSTTHTLTGLIPATEYQVRVFAKNHGTDPSGSDIGYGPVSPVTTFRTQPITPGAPSAPTVSPTDTTATVSWSAPEWHGATPIFDYNVQWRTTTAGDSWTSGPPYHKGIGTTHTITGLIPETEYQVRVVALNHGLGSLAPDYGQWSPSTTFRTNCGGSGDTNPASATVPAGWPLTPSGMCSGDKFRLLFVTSDTRDGGAFGILPYNNFVQAQARTGHDAIAPHSGIFRSLLSDFRTNAIDLTRTTYTTDNPGVPIYWVGGDKVADDYADFWDGCWDSNEARDQRGNIQQGRQVWTGSNSDGTASSDHMTNSSVLATIGKPSEECSEIDGGTLRTRNGAAVYGLSMMFEVK